MVIDSKERIDCFTRKWEASSSPRYILSNDTTAEIEKRFCMLHFNPPGKMIGTRGDEDLTAYVYI